MTEELRKYYENRISMFASEGWRDLVDDVKAMEIATNDLSSVQDEKTLHYRRGELSIMRWILTIEETSRSAFDDLKDAK